ncbi:MAG: helix-turn-helix transcriptional regulator [Acidobacteria bacterium]|nr:helix-turn-helix transcriptional regulator [Acidobacteriota bacterium]MBI3655429.1 helix-turn-helix transcriptional regulator [Acidobacteriota bacterium]
MNRQIQLALEIIGRDYDNRLSMIRLACAVHLSPSRFSHLFHQEVGQSYKGYVHQFRMRKAADMLIDGRLPIKQIADRIGFVHSRNLARAFKQHFGKIPSRYP